MDDVDKEAETIVYRGADGRTLTFGDLVGVLGTEHNEIDEADVIPRKALRMHMRGRRAGGRGNYPKAIELLNRAWELDPKWPYPVYDRAYTH